MLFVVLTLVFELNIFIVLKTSAINY